MKRLALISFAVLAIMGIMPSAWASTTKVQTCKTYHSFNGNSKVSVCVFAYQDNDADRIWVSVVASHVTGYQNPSSVYVVARDWTSHDGNDPWCDGLGGRDGPCTGGGDNSVFAGVPLVLNTAKLAPFDHFCVQHGEASMVIAWPGGGQSTPILNSPDTNTIGAGCWL
jgi:hypothetical protein